MRDPFLEYLDSPDKRRFTRFVVSYVDSVARLARSVVRHDDIADDVVQDVFLRFVEPGGILADEIRNPRAYVLRVTLNVARNRLRSDQVRSRREVAGSEMRRRYQPSALDQAITEESIGEIWSALETLPEEFRLPLYLQVFEGLTYQEIAEVTGVDSATVGTRIHRGRLQLKRLLATALTSAAWQAFVRGGRLEAALQTGIQRDLCRVALESLARRGGTPAVSRFSGWLYGGALVVVGLIIAPATLTLLVFGGSSGVSKGGEVAAVDRNVLNPSSSAKNGTVEGGRIVERSQKLGKVVRTLVAGLALSATAVEAADPGDVLAEFEYVGSTPSDIAYDSSVDGYWVVSQTNSWLALYSRDLLEVIDTTPLVFAPGPFSLTSGVAWNSIDDTLLVVDPAGPRIVELRKDGSTTGRVIDVPFRDGDSSSLGGLAFDPVRGSLLVTLYDAGVVYELSLDGSLNRSFPEDGALAALLPGELDVHLTDIDPVYRDGELDGYYAVAGTQSPTTIIRLDRDGRPTGMSFSVADTLPGVTGLLRGPFTHPELGDSVDAYICAVPQTNALVVLRGGDPVFSELAGVQCRQEDGTVQLSWTLPQEYDSIEVLEGCRALAELPGKAVSWEGTLEDGLYKLSVRVRAGFNVSTTEPCTVVVGPGSVIRSVPFEGYPVDMTGDGAGRLIVATERQLHFFSLGLEALETVDVSPFFVGARSGMDAIAHGEGETIYAYNVSERQVGTLDYAGQLLNSVSAEDLDGVEAMTFDTRGDGGVGSLWLSGAEVVVEMALNGRILRSLEQPYMSVELPHPDLSRHSDRSRVMAGGISSAKDTTSPQLWLTAGVRDQAGEPHLLRLDTETGAVRPGSTMPTAAVGVGRFFVEHVIADGASRLFLLKRSGKQRRLCEIQHASTRVSAPEFLFCRQVDGSGAVELDIEASSEYDALEIYRDCERIAVLDGGIRSFEDRDVGAGVHEYGVRGLRLGMASATTKAQLRVGPGALLQAEYVEGRHDQIARNPLTGFIYATGGGGSDNNVYRYDPDLRFDSKRPTSVPSNSTWAKPLTVRVAPDGEALLYLILRRPGISLVVETLDGQLLEEHLVDTPRNASGFAEPGGLAWESTSDTLFFVENRTRSIVQMGLEGQRLRTIEHPEPPPAGSAYFHHLRGVGFLPARKTLFATTFIPGEASKLIEMTFDGVPTGVDIPVSLGEHAIGGIVFADDTWFAVSYERRLLRMQGTDNAALLPVAFFLRGDANDDGTVNISDSLRTFDYLFLGGDASACLDAMDGDDDGRINLTDGTYVLNFLFLGGPPPPPPYPVPGLDRTADLLACEEGVGG